MKRSSNSKLESDSSSKVITHNRKFDSGSSSEVITHIEIQKEIDMIHIIIHIGFPNLQNKKKEQSKN
jgi:small subunit ribosomal protein S3